MLSRQESNWYLLILEVYGYLYDFMTSCMSLRDDIMILHFHALFGTNSPNMAGETSCNNTLLHIPLPIWVMSS